MSSWFPSIFSASEDQQEEKTSNLDKIEILCERIKATSILQDKRTALSELKLLVKDCKLEVGTRSLDLLMDLLEKNSSDHEISLISLELLNEITKSATAISSDEKSTQYEEQTNLSKQFCEILLKNSNNVTTLLKLAESSDYMIRWHVLKIFNTLAQTQLLKLQNLLPEIHFAHAYLLEYLNETREVIRNDCIILLLQLTKNHDNLQKLFAFENLFDKLFDVIYNDINDNIVINDCILIMCNVLRKNTATQQCFLEFGCFSKVKIFFDSVLNNLYDLNSTGIVQCMVSMLGLCRIFIDTTYKDGNIRVQEVLKVSGIMKHCFDIIFSIDVADRLIIEAILTLSFIIYSNPSNRANFDELMNFSFKTDGIIKTLGLICNPKKSVIYRKAMIFLVKSYLQNNSEISRTVSECLNSQNSELYRLITSGLFDNDEILNLMSTVVFCTLLLDFPALKTTLLNLEIDKRNFQSPQPHSQPHTPSFIPHCIEYLNKTNISAVCRINLLTLLVFLVHDFPDGIQSLVSVHEICSFLISGVRTFISHEFSDGYSSIFHGLFSILISIVINYSTHSISDKKHLESLRSRISISDLIEYIGAFSKLFTRFHHFKPSTGNSFAYCYFEGEFTHICKKTEVFVFDMRSRTEEPVITNTNPSPSAQFVLKSAEILSLQDEVSKYQFKALNFETRYLSTTQMHKILTRDYFYLLCDYRQLIFDYENILKLCSKQDEFIQDLKNEVKSVRFELARAKIVPSAPCMHYPSPSSSCPTSLECFSWKSEFQDNIFYQSVTENDVIEGKDSLG